MAAVSTSLAVHLLPLFLLVATSDSTTIDITNQCSYTVWPAAAPIGGGLKLAPEETWTLNMPAGTVGQRIWPRTGCSFDRKGNGSCQTGDCDGLIACKANGQPPSTLAEFSQIQTKDFFDISLVDGFNVPMAFLPMPTKGVTGCSKGPRCAANIRSRCPSELQTPGGCNNVCTVFKQDKYCCIGTNSSNCKSINYSTIFKQMCPDAFSYPLDSSGTFACPTGTSYQVIFCPLINQTIAPAAPSPLPISPVERAPLSPSPLPVPGGPTRMNLKSSSVKRVVGILASIGSFILPTMLFTSIFFICKRRTR